MSYVEASHVFLGAIADQCQYGSRLRVQLKPRLYSYLWRRTVHMSMLGLVKK